MQPIPAALLTLGLLAAGCAPLPSTDARSVLAPELAARGLEVDDSTLLEELRGGLAGQEITPETAVRIALLNNPGLQAEYAVLGFAAADVYEAARPRNPSLSVSVLSSDESGAADQVGFGISQHFTELLTLGARTRIAEGEYERVRQQIGASILETAADAEAVVLQVASAAQMVAVREAIARAASASAGLAQRVFDAGNISRLELALEKADAAESSLALMEARSGLGVARAELNAVMGLGAADDTWRAPATVPGLPEADAPVEALLSLADEKRLDLAAARAELRLRADALGLTRRFRLLGEVDVELSTERETDRSRITGPALGVELPLFDQGAGRVARAQAQLDHSDAALRALEVDISTSIRARAALLAAARERAAQYRDVLIPLREEIVALMQRQVNYMLDDPSQALLARQKAFAAYQGYLEAVRDYQLARVELVRAVGAPLPASAGAVAAPLDARGLIAPSPGAGHGMDHTDMNHGRAEHHGVDHGGMNHGGMDHGAPDRDATGHEGMHHERAKDPALPQHDTHSGEPR